MTYPETVCQELDKAIAHEMNLETRFEPKNSHRDRKVTREDIIKFLIYMEGGSLQAELLKAKEPLIKAHKKEVYSQNRG